MGSARIKEHPRLTVSTETGMLHYELQPQSQLLFLAITLADLPQSAAFTFLHQLRGDAELLLCDRALPPAQQPRVPLREGSVYVVPGGLPYEVRRAQGSIGLVVTNDPLGNK